MSYIQLPLVYVRPTDGDTRFFTLLLVHASIVCENSVVFICLDPNILFLRGGKRSAIRVLSYLKDVLYQRTFTPVHCPVASSLQGLLR